MAASVLRDERTISIENASYRWAHHILSFGLLAVVCYRALLWNESNWDLMVLVVIGSGIPLIYQGRRRVLTVRWPRFVLVAVLVSAAVAAAVVWLRLGP